MEVYQTIFSDPMRTEKFTKTVVAGVIQHFEMTYETLLETSSRIYEKRIWT